MNELNISLNDGKQIMLKFSDEGIHFSKEKEFTSKELEVYIKFFKQQLEKFQGFRIGIQYANGELNTTTKS